MPFPLKLKFIEDAENELGVLFPDLFKNKMMQENGGEIQTDEDDWQFYPFLDKSDNKRISRTCNHIGLETKQAREWKNFPKNAIAIATNGFGDYLILLPDEKNPKRLKDDVYIWLHETGEFEKLADTIIDLINH